MTTSAAMQKTPSYSPLSIFWRRRAKGKKPSLRSTHYTPSSRLTLEMSSCGCFLPLNLLPKRRLWRGFQKHRSRIAALKIHLFSTTPLLGGSMLLSSEFALRLMSRKSERRQQSANQSRRRLGSGNAAAVSDVHRKAER